MRKVELQDILPPGLVSHQSRSDVLQQLALPSGGAGGFALAGALSVAGGSNAFTADGLSSLLQGPVKDVTEQVSALTTQITSLNSIQQMHIGATQDNTQAVTENTASKGGGSRIGSTVGSIASNLLGGGLSLSPIISGLMSLFGGSSQPATILAPFRLPAPVQYQAGISGGSTGQVVPVDYGQSGQVRTQSTSPAPQVNIQVNALDSQSFLDHSDEIARAVKQAMLTSSDLNDVISDL